MRRTIFYLITCTFLILSSVLEAYAISYSFTSIDFPYPLSNRIEANDINDSGQVVVSYSHNGYHSYLYKGGGFSKFIVYLGATSTKANGINNAGQIVGTYDDSHGFLYDPVTNSSTTIDYNTLPYTVVTRLYDINDTGMIVGAYYDSVATYYQLTGLLYDTTTSTFTPFLYHDIFGMAHETVIHGINNSNQIVGYYISGVHRGFVYDLSSGYKSDIYYPGSSETIVWGINDMGIMVGGYAGGTSPHYHHGFLYDSGTGFITVDYPGSVETVISGINNNGEIVGWYRDTSDNIYGFYGTPISSVPEPPVILLLAAGFAGVIFFRKWSRTGIGC